MLPSVTVCRLRFGTSTLIVPSSKFGAMFTPFAACRFIAMG